MSTKTVPQALERGADQSQRQSSDDNALKEWIREPGSNPALDYWWTLDQGILLIPP